MTMTDLYEFKPTLMLPDLHFALCTEDIVHINATPAFRRCMEKRGIHRHLDKHAVCNTPRRRFSVLGAPQIAQFGSIVTNGVWLLCDQDKHNLEHLSWGKIHRLTSVIRNHDYIGPGAVDVEELNAIHFEDCVREVIKKNRPFNGDDDSGTVVLADSHALKDGWSAADILDTNIRSARYTLRDW
jgi:hypothetical protein